ncbi:MAG: outer membrane lipoprotein carrier protein LolA [Hyphomonadaceae bacterium]
MTTMKRFYASALSLALAAASLPAASAQPGSADQARAALARSGAQPGAVELSGAERVRALARASASLNAMRTLQGRFVQWAPSGQATTGDFYLQRPGKLRFAYDSPASLLIVADGSILAVQDTALRSVNRAPLRSTPLYFVLKNNIDLERDARVTHVARQGDTLYVTARDRTGAAQGDITLAFVGAEAQLRSWDVVDATGARTRLALTNVSRPAALDQRLFRTPEPPRTGRPR